MSFARTRMRSQSLFLDLVEVDVGMNRMRSELVKRVRHLYDGLLNFGQAPNHQAGVAEWQTLRT